ncbi:hypothetical protein KP509_35G044100 [Ceratopteris richardii]|uniref:ACT domain-containing protein n=1 Tax=Ceratopteris richardii TaxID=49495 RepID=A0A8T2QEW5_CERRI|nr:hypothetical protein KP509_35G044100 [Ceratopteris richardii]
MAMSTVCWPYFDPEYETLSQRINPPRVVIDNKSLEDCTLIKVDSANKHGILLEVVQVLTDLDLTVSKAYISSDGSWFMDVFHVTDQLGKKVEDESMIEYIQQALGAKQPGPNSEVQTCLGRLVGMQSMSEHTVIELIGADRPGLLSEIFAVLTNHNCNIVAAEAWTHNTRAASVVYVTDHDTLGPINDNQKLTVMKEQLQNVLRGAEDCRGVKTNFSLGLTHKDRRLHQIMFADRDYEGFSDCSVDSKLNISIDNCVEKGYSVVNIRCLDRPKLLYDIVCTITDMQYVVSHGTIDSDGPFANQEYYIRHMDGCTLDTEGEKQRVIKCLEAAIKRRSPQGIRLELCTTDRVGLLSEITRVFRENGLSIANAGVTTQGEKAVNSFYVTNMSGGPVDMRIIEAVRNEIGKQILSVKDGAPKSKEPSYSLSTLKSALSLGTLLRFQWDRLSNVSLIK